MECGRCGAQLARPVHFCTQCGAPLEADRPHSPPPIPSRQPTPTPAAVPPPIPRSPVTAPEARAKRSPVLNYALLALLLVILSLGGWWGVSSWQAHHGTQTEAVAFPTPPPRATAPAPSPVVRVPVAAQPIPVASSSHPAAPRATPVTRSAQKTPPLVRKPQPVPPAVVPNPYASSAYKQRKEQELQQLLGGH